MNKVYEFCWQTKEISINSEYSIVMGEHNTFVDVKYIM